MQITLWDIPRPKCSFPGSSAGKESPRNKGDPGLISGWGSSTGDRIG